MLARRFLEQVKTNNISRDNEVSKKRIKAIFDSGTNVQIDEALNLAGYRNPRPIFCRINLESSSTSPTLTARATLAIAQTFRVDPFYLIAETDEDHGYNIDTVVTFLKKYAQNTLRKSFLCQI